MLINVLESTIVALFGPKYTLSVEVQHVPRIVSLPGLVRLPTVRVCEATEAVQGGVPLTTAIDSVQLSVPAAFCATTVYVVAPWIADGIPLINPVVLLIVKLAGSAG